MIPWTKERNAFFLSIFLFLRFSLAFFDFFLLHNTNKFMFSNYRSQYFTQECDILDKLEKTKSKVFISRTPCKMIIAREIIKTTALFFHIQSFKQ